MRNQNRSKIKIQNQADKVLLIEWVHPEKARNQYKNSMLKIVKYYKLKIL